MSPPPYPSLENIFKTWISLDQKEKIPHRLRSRLIGINEEIQTQDDDNSVEDENTENVSNEKVEQYKDVEEEKNIDI